MECEDNRPVWSAVFHLHLHSNATFHVHAQVDKQEKKKDPRGRAKKRMQYNRRFVNVVTGVGGKKLGPNSNAAKV